MRRADRLFQIIQILRRADRPVTAASLAEELETSKRTVYRDIADLIGQRVPVRGEAGLGYVLGGGFDMPPLMLTADEIEAAVLGAQWVAGRGDPVLASAAADLVAKIRAAVPDRLRSLLAEPVVTSPPGRAIASDGLDVARTRAWIRLGRKINIRYRSARQETSERTIWPIVVGYFESVRVLAAWCELRGEFRHFRTDRVAGAEFLPERHPCRRAELHDRWTQNRIRNGARDGEARA